MSNRREFLQTLVAGTACGLAAKSGLSLASGSAMPADFGGAFKSVPKSFEKRALTLEGNWPTDLRGSLYRNSPAMLERNGFQHSHLFDGDGMIQKFSLGDGKVFHQAQMVATDKFLNEEDADRFLYHGLGSSPPNARAARNNDSANPANISVRKMGDKLFALWEAGSAYEIDPENLSTYGRVDWGEDLKHLPFSAHPLRDANGDWWNIGSWIYSGQARTIIYQLDAQAKLKRVKAIPMNQAGYMHAFALSQRFVILVNTAHLYTPGKRYFDSFNFDAKGKTEIVLLDKNDLSVFKTIEIPANFVFHFGNAFEQGEELFISMAEYRNADIMSKGLGLGPHSAFAKEATQYNSDLSVYRINLKNGKWQKQSSQLAMEFPNFRESTPFTVQNLIGMGRPTGTANKADQDYLISYHPLSGEREIYDFGNGFTIEEPLFINGASGQEYVIHSLADRQKSRSGLALFRSGELKAGPIAMAWAEEQFPFGFHGCFVPS
ncbi:carotenoid oxygenase family protein [uncultured Pseudoteredinibacter sp.]|uniref:carotenoid oxygenase family protein n=1 Tax=uncultured Pseudoteredinibacter sp. TaxID=1641701 RepID=UPI00261818B3|nr:carotenoid oxygenase family protein [uncultured Pseudoteredinibacter sp.]